MVRIYLGEREGRLDALLDFLRDVAGVSGWTVYRGISGYGPSGKVRTASLVDLALDLPITVELFETADKLEGLLPELNALAGDGHVVYWPATLMTDEP